MSNAQMWMRYFRLIIQKRKGEEEALDLSGFHVQFDISQALLNKPCTATIIIYNISEETAAKIRVDDKPTLVIEAGYQNNHGEIFRGDLYWCAFGRTSETETVLRIVAATGMLAARYAVASASMQKGVTQKQQFNVLRSAVQAYGVGLNIPDDGLDQTALPRGKVIWGAAKYCIQNCAKTSNLEYGWTGDGLKAISGATPSDSPTYTLLNPSTGLLDRPTVSVDGVRAISLLNPQLEMGRVVRIEATINRPNADTSVSTGAIAANAVARGDFLDPYGFYKVYARTHRGDTRGTSWETEIYCAGLSSKFKPGTFSSTPFQYARNHDSDEMGFYYK